MSNKKMMVIIGIVLILDMVSKYVVSSLMVENQSFSIINNFFRITYVKNTGAAFSFLDGNVLVLILVTIFFLGCMFYYTFFKVKNFWEGVSYGLVLGGAIGNFIDRSILGYVRDFIDIDIFDYDYPIFNIADCFIVIGILMYLFISFYKERCSRDGNKS